MYNSFVFIIPHFLEGKNLRFEPVWLLDDRFRQEVSNSWPVQAEDVKESLLVLRANLITWNKNIFGNVIGGIFS